MAKKVSKNARTDRGKLPKREMVKVIKAIKSPKGSSYTFKEDIVDVADVNKYV